MRTMTGMLVLAMAATAAAQNTAAEARHKLAAQKLSVQFEEASLDTAVSFLRDATGMNFHIGATVAEHAPDAKVRLKVRDVSVRTILKLMLQPHDLSATWRDGTILILPRGEAHGNKTMRIYDARSLMVKIRDFPGPRVELVGPESVSAGGPLVSATFVLDDPEPVINEDTLVELIRENTGGQSWHEDSDVSIDLANGRLVVTQSAAVHREIATLLRKLEQYR